MARQSDTPVCVVLLDLTMGEDPRVLALFDPQTSGGLLMAVAPEKHAFLVEELKENGVGAWTVGEVTSVAAGVANAAAGAISLAG